MDDRVIRLLGTGAGAVFGLIVVLAALAAATVGRGSELRETPTVRAVKAAWPAVVSIRGEKTLATPPAMASVDAARRVNGMGTGVIIDPQGYIVTNFHVVQGVRDILVSLTDGSEYSATLVARDMETDLAIIKIEPRRPLATIRIGTSGDLMVAEPVIAIGNPYGYSQTVTTGIISSLHRALQVSDAQYYDDLIQTDASINPGNSGGPLLNIDGHMIGVTVAVRTGAQGIAFAIPVDKVVDVLARLLDERVRERFTHGIRLETAPHGRQVLAESLPGAVMPVSLVAVPKAPELTVRSVESDSPAERAGILPGDIIVRVADEPLSTPLDFHRALLGCDPDQSLLLTVQRKDSLLQTEMRLASTSPAWSVLGLDLAPITPEDFRQRFNKTIYRGGLTVVRVRADGPAAARGVLPGDVLVGLHLWETASLGNVQFILSRPDFNQLNPLKFTILREGRALYGYLEVSEMTRATASHDGTISSGDLTASIGTSSSLR